MINFPLDRSRRVGVHERRGASRGMWVGKAVSSAEMRSVRAVFFFWTSKRKVTIWNIKTKPKNVKR